jgi:hypothetical protein
MNTERQLDFFATDKPADAAWLIEHLRGRGWVNAGAILREIGAPDSDAARRRLRATAEASEGQVASGQGGYKLVQEMTKEEFDHFCAWMLSQAGKMQRRITLAQKVFFARYPVPA